MLKLNVLKGIKEFYVENVKKNMEKFEIRNVIYVVQ